MGYEYCIFEELLEVYFFGNVIFIFVFFLVDLKMFFFNEVF